MKLKVIFLDIDGVLTSLVSREKNNFAKNEFSWDSNCVEQLERILANTSAKIIIASHGATEDPQMIKRGFKLFGLPIPLFWLKVTHESKKSELVQQWIDQNKPDQYVILDDNADRVSYKDQDNFVQTPTGLGLTKPFADRAIGILNGH